MLSHTGVPSGSVIAVVKSKTLPLACGFDGDTLAETCNVSPMLICR